MNSLCPSCREPLDYPSGDGCAAMTRHEERSDKMSDYNQTRTVAGGVVSRFADMLRELEDDYEEEIVVASLMKHHMLVITEYDDEELLWAIERVLRDYMSPSQYAEWCRGNALRNLAKADTEDDLI